MVLIMFQLITYCCFFSVVLFFVAFSLLVFSFFYVLSDISYFIFSFPLSLQFLFICLPQHLSVAFSLSIYLSSIHLPISIHLHLLSLLDTLLCLPSPCVSPLTAHSPLPPLLLVPARRPAVRGPVAGGLRWRSLVRTPAPPPSPPTPTLLACLSSPLLFLLFLLLLRYSLASLLLFFFILFPAIITLLICLSSLSLLLFLLLLRYTLVFFLFSHNFLFIFLLPSLILSCLLLAPPLLYSSFSNFSSSS